MGEGVVEPRGQRRKSKRAGKKDEGNGVVGLGTAQEFPATRGGHRAAREGPLGWARDLRSRGHLRNGGPRKSDAEAEGDRGQFDAVDLRRGRLRSLMHGPRQTVRPSEPEARASDEQRAASARDYAGGRRPAPAVPRTHEGTTAVELKTDVNLT